MKNCSCAVEQGKSSAMDPELTDPSRLEGLRSTRNPSGLRGTAFACAAIGRAWVALLQGSVARI